MKAIELDVHTHTVASGHAYGTVAEMGQEAARKGLKLLGITKHGKGIPGTCDEIYFRNLHVLPRKQFGISMLFGGEINIMDYDGNLGTEERILKLLDIRIAGIHSICYKIGNEEENTNAVISAMRNPYTDIGNFGEVIGLLEEAEFPEELIINYSMERFLAFIGKNREKE